MTDRTLGIIKAIKQRGKVWNRAVAEYISERTGTPIEDYTEYDLNIILKEAFLDYIATCDNPAFEVETLINLMTSFGDSSLGCHLANILGMTQVRDKDDNYVNGFRKIKGDE